MLVVVLCYLMIWTWTQTHESEIKMTSAGFKYKRCVREWFSNAIEIGKLSPVYTTLNFWYGTDKIVTRTTFLVLGLPSGTT
jgi:hypothetical protein